MTLPPRFIPPPSDSDSYVRSVPLPTDIYAPSTSQGQVTAEYKLNHYSVNGALPITFGFLLGILAPVGFYFLLRFQIIDLTPTFDHFFKGLTNFDAGGVFLSILLMVVGFATIWFIIFILFIAGIARSHGNASHIFGTVLYVLGLFSFIFTVYIGFNFF